jgi:hypothetical protein
LFCLNDADYTDLNKATDMSWSVHQDEDVDWIAVFTEGRRRRLKSNGNSIPSGRSPPSMERPGSGS